MSAELIALAEQVTAERQAAAEELAGLSRREREMLILTAKGVSAEEIARLCGCHKSTVRNHKYHLRRSLGMTVIEAAVLATKAGWV